VRVEIPHTFDAFHVSKEKFHGGKEVWDAIGLVLLNYLLQMTKSN